MAAGTRRRWGGRIGQALARDRGSSAAELVILAPVLLLLIWLTVQYAMYTQGRQVAQAAAQIGDRVARQDVNTVPNWQALAEQSARSYYQGLGTRVLGRNGITVIATPAGSGRVTVTVKAQVASILLGLKLPISEQASGPVECFRPDRSGGRQC